MAASAKRFAALRATTTTLLLFILPEVFAAGNLLEPASAHGRLWNPYVIFVCCCACVHTRACVCVHDDPFPLPPLHTQHRSQHTNPLSPQHCEAGLLLAALGGKIREPFDTCVETSRCVCVCGEISNFEREMVKRQVIFWAGEMRFLNVSCGEIEDLVSQAQYERAV